MSNTLNNLLTRLGESLGLGPLVLDDSGALGLSIDGQILGLQQDADRELLLLYADLGPLPAGTPEATRETLLIRLLQASLFGRLAADGALALAPDHRDPERPQRVVLWRTLELAALDLPRLEQALRQLADTVADWREALAEWSDGSAGSAARDEGRGFDVAMAIRV